MQFVRDILTKSGLLNPRGQGVVHLSNRTVLNRFKIVKLLEKALAGRAFSNIEWARILVGQWTAINRINYNSKIASALNSYLLLMMQSPCLIMSKIYRTDVHQSAREIAVAHPAFFDTALIPACRSRSHSVSGMD